jgi:hypothetical protein
MRMAAAIVQASTRRTSRTRSGRGTDVWCLITSKRRSRVRNGCAPGTGILVISRGPIVPFRHPHHGPGRRPAERPPASVHLAHIEHLF